MRFGSGGTRQSVIDSFPSWSLANRSLADFVFNKIELYGLGGVCQLCGRTNFSDLEAETRILYIVMIDFHRYPASIK